MTATHDPVETTRPDKVRVPNPADMDLPTFCQHVQARHGDSIPAGFKLIPDKIDEYVEECWRNFHERLHRLRVPIDNPDFQTPEYDHTHLPLTEPRRIRERRHAR